MTYAHRSEEDQAIWDAWLRFRSDKDSIFEALFDHKADVQQENLRAAMDAAALTIFSLSALYVAMDEAIKAQAKQQHDAGVSVYSGVS